MTNEEKVKILIEAMDLVKEAREMVEGAISGTDQEHHWTAYGEGGLQQATGMGNPYDDSIPKLITAIQGTDDSQSHIFKAIEKLTGQNVVECHRAGNVYQFKNFAGEWNTIFASFVDENINAK